MNGMNPRLFHSSRCSEYVTMVNIQNMLAFMMNARLNHADRQDGGHKSTVEKDAHLIGKSDFCCRHVQVAKPINAVH